MGSSKPLVSVIIPLYNAGNYIGETIESIVNQSYSNIEIIIVDDGSTDDPLAVLKRFESDNVHVYHQNNSGAPVARNYGFKLSKGQYIQYLDADDKLTPQKIEKQVDALEKVGQDAIATSVVFVSEGGKEYLWNMPEIYHNYERGFDLLVDLWYYFVPSLALGAYLIPRKLIEESDGWDESLKKNQDGEFFSRLLINVRKVVCVEGEGQVWRIRPDSTSHKASTAKTESVLRSYSNISDLMLSVEDSPRVRHAIAVAYGSFIINDSNRKYGDLALKRLKELGIKPCYRINSKYFLFLEKLFQPQTAFVIFKKIQSIRGRMVYFSNDLK